MSLLTLVLQVFEQSHLRSEGLSIFKISPSTVPEPHPMADPDDAIAAKIDVGEAITTIRGKNRHTYAATRRIKGEKLTFSPVPTERTLRTVAFTCSPCLRPWLPLQKSPVAEGCTESYGLHVPTVRSNSWPL